MLHIDTIGSCYYYPPFQMGKVRHKQVSNRLCRLPNWQGVSWSWKPSGIRFCLFKPETVRFMTW